VNGSPCRQDTLECILTHRDGLVAPAGAKELDRLEPFAGDWVSCAEHAPTP
jgi:hypothetical protein